MSLMMLRFFGSWLRNDKSFRDGSDSEHAWPQDYNYYQTRCYVTFEHVNENV